MAYCRNCGNPISEEAEVCTHCGSAQEKSSGATGYGEPPVNSYYNEPQQQNYAPSAPPVEDNGGFGWGLLGCCIPIVGLVLFLVWKNEKPRTAKAAGVGALVCVGLYILLYVVLFAFGILAGIMG